MAETLTERAVTGVISLIVGGTGGTAIATFVKGKSEARKTDAETRTLNARTPIELDSLAVQGADAAVLTMQRSLQSAEATIIRLERERDHDRGRIEQLEARIVSLQETLTEAQTALTGLRQELGQFVTEQGTRH